MCVSGGGGFGRGGLLCPTAELQGVLGRCGHGGTVCGLGGVEWDGVRECVGAVLLLLLGEAADMPVWFGVLG